MEIYDLSYGNQKHKHRILNKHLMTSRNGCAEWQQEADIDKFKLTIEKTFKIPDRKIQVYNFLIESLIRFEAICEFVRKNKTTFYKVIYYFQNLVFK